MSIIIGFGKKGSDPSLQLYLIWRCCVFLQYPDSVSPPGSTGSHLRIQDTKKNKWLHKSNIIPNVRMQFDCIIFKYRPV